MLQSTGIALVSGFWALLYLLDNFLKTKNWSSRIYLHFLNWTGISVKIAQVRLYTTCFNRLFVRIGSCKQKFLKIWFTCGVGFGLIAMFLSVFLLTLLVVNTLKQAPVEQQILTPVMPGVNLPMGQIVYYLLTLFVCGVLHEVGHAVAAVREQVRVNGFGIFVFIIYPGAFVDLYTDHLQVISPVRQLRIYCAGVWHNFVLVIIALIILAVMPWILVPFYTIGNGIAITGVTDNSAVSGPRGLVVGDEVTKISDCRITTMTDWATCIRVSMAENPTGFCMPLDLVKQQDISEKFYTTPVGNIECCSNTSNTHLCFLYNLKASFDQNYACLPARTTTERPSCRLQSDCKIPNTPSVCVTPSLDNSTKLLKVYHTGKPPLLFLGHPLDLHYAVLLSDYVPKTIIVPLNFPYVLETFCKYVISLSGALAILNVVPCYALDGQWILLSFIELTLRSIIRSPETRGLIYSIILLFGTLLLSSNIVIAMWVLFVR